MLLFKFINTNVSNFLTTTICDNIPVESVVSTAGNEQYIGGINLDGITP